MPPASMTIVLQHSLIHYRLQSPLLWETTRLAGCSECTQPVPITTLQLTVFAVKLTVLHVLQYFACASVRVGTHMRTQRHVHLGHFFVTAYQSMCKVPLVLQ